MKLRAKANGMLLDLSDSEAEAYLSTGLYDVVEESPKESTKVEPLMTTDMPQKKKRGAK